MATIGVFDSGVGGLSVLREIRKLLPDDKYLYFSDNANCPYGGREESFIIGRAREITDFLLEKGAEIIVVACNTATAAAISTLRKEFPDTPFIGMEPAVKPAASGTRSGVIGVLATAGTLAASKYQDTKTKYGSDVRIVEHVGEGFVELVESGETSGPRAEEIVRRSLVPLLEQGADRIVLGCTHYPFLTDTIRKVAGGDIEIIDPSPAVARHLSDVMAERGITPSTGGGSVSLFSSGSPENLERTLKLIE